jgi:hypothetical protein
MTDFRPVPPPPDGFARAVSSARRRRLRTAGLSTGLASAGLVVAAVLAGSSGTSSLSQDAPVTDQPTQPSVVTTGTPVADAAAERGTAMATPPGRSPGAVGSSSPTPAGNAVPRPTSGTSYVAAPISSVHNQLTVPNCLGGAPPVCMTVGRTSTGLSAQGCPSETGPVQLHVRDAREVDLWVTQGDRTVWRWSASHPATGRAHTGRLDSGHCSSWALAWDAVDGQGRKLPAGDYVMHARLLARETPDAIGEFALTIEG